MQPTPATPFEPLQSGSFDSCWFKARTGGPAGAYGVPFSFLGKLPDDVTQWYPATPLDPSHLGSYYARVGRGSEVFGEIGSLPGRTQAGYRSFGFLTG